MLEGTDEGVIVRGVFVGTTVIGFLFSDAIDFR